MENENNLNHYKIYRIFSKEMKDSLVLPEEIQEIYMKQLIKNDIIKIIDKNLKRCDITKCVDDDGNFHYTFEFITNI